MKFRLLYTGILIFLLFSFITLTYGQGSENFANIPVTNASNYAARSWTGTDNVVWNAQSARTDTPLNGKALCFGTAGTGSVTSPTYAGGMGTLTFTYVRGFTSTTGTRILQVWVNNVQIGSDINVNMSSNTPVTYSQAINITGNVVLEIKSVGTKQVKVDDISWTGYTGSATSCVSPAAPTNLTITNQSDITKQDITFTPTTANGYLLIKSNAALSTGPMDGTVYMVGDALGGGQIISIGSNTAFTSTGLSPFTNYIYTVYAYNSGCIGEPVYSSPLSGNQTTGLENGNLSESCVTNTSYQISYAPPSSTNDGVVIVARENGTPSGSLPDFSALSGASSNFGLASSVGTTSKLIYAGPSVGASNLTISGITPGATLSVKAYSYKGSTSTIYSSGTQISELISLPTVLSGTAGILNSALDLSWTLPVNSTCYDEIMVVAKNSAFSGLIPNGNGSGYIANSVYGNGSAFDGGYVIYKGASNSVTLSSLTNGTTYTIEIFVRKGTDWSTPFTFTGTPTSTPPSKLEIGDLFLLGITSKDVNLVAGGCPTATNTDDRVDLVSMVDINPGTMFTITDNGWERDFPNSFGYSEGTYNFTYTGTSVLAAGTVFSWYLGTISAITTINASNHWDVSYTVPSQTGAIAISNNNDQIYITQGGAWSFVSGNRLENNGLTVLAAATLSGAWISAANTNTSNLHPQSYCNNITLTGSYLNYTGSITPADPLQWYARINSMANWTVNTTCSSYVAAIPVSLSVNPYSTNITWIGNGNNYGLTNWFNCENWNPAKVPSKENDVVITGSSTNFPKIDLTAPNASFYNQVANCKNLTLDGGTLTFAGTNANQLYINGNFNFTNNSTLNMNSGSNVDGKIKLNGNWLETGTNVFNYGQSIIEFGDSPNQLIKTSSSGASTFYQLIMNNRVSDVQYTNGLSIAGNLQFIDGCMSATDSSAITFLDNATSTGAHDTSLVSGKVIKKGNDSFLFPVGKKGNFKPLEISAPASISDVFEAEYYYSLPININAKDVSLDHVSSVEFWDLQRSAGTSSVDVSLFWNNLSLVNPGIDLRIAHYNGLIWEDLIGVKDVQNSKMKVINVNSFSPFTFATANSFQSLNLEDLIFTVNKNDKSVLISWQANELVDVVIQKKKNDDQFMDLDYTYNKKSGSKEDVNLSEGIYTYRLKVKKSNESDYKYSDIKTILIKESSTITIFPNPTHDFLHLKGLLGNAEQISITDMSGKIIFQVINYDTHLDIPVSSWSSGHYNITIDQKTYDWMKL